MTRIIKEGIAAVNQIVERCEAQELTVTDNDIDTSNYARYDYLHNGLLVFPDVFLEEKESRSLLLYIGGYEEDTTLFLPAFTLYLFSECDISPVKNNAFSFSANTTISDAIAVIDVPSASWKTCKSNGSDTSAWLKHAVTNSDVLKQIAASKDIYGIAVFNSDTGAAFAAGATFKLWLGIQYS